MIGGSIGLLHDLLRVDLGYATRTGALGLTVDIRPSFWPIL